MPYNTDPRLLAAIRQYGGDPDMQATLLATTWVESGGRLDAVGDSGHSHGAFQEYDRGRGAGLSVTQSQDPVGSTKRALREFKQYAAKGLSGGQLAAAAQRPANQGVYAQRVQSLIDDARRALGGQATRSQMQTFSGAMGQSRQYGASGKPSVQTKAPDLGGALVAGVASRQPGEGLSTAVLRGLMSVVGQPAVSQSDGVKLNPSGASPMAQAKDTGGKPGAVAAARRWIGTPYSWGGGNPDGPTTGIGRGAGTVGFDCSSLVQNAWAAMGVKIPRTTYLQIKIGTGIPANNMSAWRPGDLVFPHTGHVQMYIGNGKVIEAPYTGARVRVTNVRGAIAVRRPG